MDDYLAEKYLQVINKWFFEGFSGRKSRLNAGKKCYVYILVNSLNNEIFYVGKGKGKRMFHHENEFKKGKITNAKKFERIGSIFKNGGKVLKYVVCNELSSSEALFLESKIIDANRDLLTNSQSGILSNGEKDIIWAKNMLDSMMEFDKWMLIKLRPQAHIDLYFKQKNDLQKIANGSKKIIRGVEIKTINGVTKNTFF